MKTYQSLKAFYSDVARSLSGEADYGVWWTDIKLYPSLRVSYVQRTGEVYAIELGAGQVEILGVVPPDPEEWTTHGLSRRRGRYYATLDRILEGWPDRCGPVNGLA